MELNRPRRKKHFKIKKFADSRFCCSFAKLLLSKFEGKELRRSHLEAIKNSIINFIAKLLI